MTSASDPFRMSATVPVEDDDPLVDWTVALAGGEGTRLQDYVKRRFGCEIPKQYCPLLGSRSTLQHTLDRLNQLTPPSRTLSVIGPTHASFAMPQLLRASDHVFRQPASRGTGIALCVALAMIKRWNANAVVTVTPTDHYIAPSARYVEVLQVARSVAGRMRDAVVVLGIRPSGPDPDFGYLSLGAPVPLFPEVRHLAGFVEKPSVTRAEELIATGALWNTMVMCGTVDALWAVARGAEPQLLDVLDSLVPLIDTPDESEAIEWLYASTPPINFSSDVLERAHDRIVALEVEGVDWSDWGRPVRIETVLAQRRARANAPRRTAHNDF